MQEVTDPLPVGVVIQERYIVESLLGKGGFGSIYLVRDQHNKQQLFVLAEVINPNEQERYRFTLEYVSLTPFHHRTLPHVQYVFNDDKLSRAYLLMSYIEEPNLEISRLQQSEKRFPLPQVMAIMAPVTNAVTYLHHRRPPVIHQNIKPAVIVPRAVGGPVLVILGIVKEHDSTATTLHYFAPGYGATEQYREEFSVRTDIHGLGATCYTLLTSIIPPDALYRSTQLSNGEIDPLKPVNEVISTIPTHIAETIQRAMSINADDRFSSVEQFWEALGAPARQSSLGLSRSMPSPASPSPAASRPTVEKPATASVLQQPRARRPWKLGTLWPAASKQAVAKPASLPKQLPAHHARKLGTFWSLAREQTIEKLAPVLKPLRISSSWKLGVVFILLVLLSGFGLSVGLSTDTGFWVRTVNHPVVQTLRPASPTPTPPSVSAIYPTIAGTYNGTIYDIPVNVRTSLSFTNVRESQGKISGYLTVGPGLLGYGSFSGTIDAAKHLQFTVTDADGNPTLFFEGDMQSATSLSGDYYRCNPAQGNPCVRGPVGYGIWNVLLSSSASSASTGTNPSLAFDKAREILVATSP